MNGTLRVAMTNLFICLSNLVKHAENKTADRRHMINAKTLHVYSFQSSSNNGENIGLTLSEPIHDFVTAEPKKWFNRV